MKYSLKIFSMLMLATVLLVSCSKDEDPDTKTPPAITSFKAGNHDHHGNTIVNGPGAEVIVDFTAETRNDGRLSSYHIEIHDHPESGNPDDEYIIIDQHFEDDPKFQGTRNASIHKHIAIPADAPLGEYHVELIVFDEFGNTTMEDAHFYLVEEK